MQCDYNTISKYLAAHATLFNKCTDLFVTAQCKVTVELGNWLVELNSLLKIYPHVPL